MEVNTIKSKDKKIICSLCNTGFTKKKQNLNRHLTNIHEANPRRHFCPLCGFKTIRKINLKSHMKIKHEAIIEEFKINSKPIADIHPSEPLPYIPPFEARVTGGKKIRRADSYTADNVILNYLKTPATHGLTESEIPNDFKPFTSAPTPTKDEPMSPYTVKVVKTSTITYAIKRTPFFYARKHSTE